MPTPDAIHYHEEFDFDLAGAVQSQLLQKFKELGVGQFTPEVLKSVKAKQGVYQLYRAGALVYIGKAKSLKLRLRKHYRTLSGRLNVNMEKMGFKCLSVHRNWTPLTHEESLIKYYRDGDVKLWNGSGFGSNDPGRQREETNQPPQGFHRQYPIDENWTTSLAAGSRKIEEILESLKGDLPYLFRYQRGSVRSDFKRGMTIPRDRMKAKELLVLVAQSLPPGWQATIFPSHMILYKESRAYEHGNVVWPTKV